MAYFMNRQMKLLPIIFILLLSCINPKRKETVQTEVVDSLKLHSIEIQNEKIIEPFRLKALTNEISEKDTVEATIDSIHYKLFPNGKIIYNKINTNKFSSFRLTTNMIVETAYLLNYKNDLIIYYVETDYDLSSSLIECYDIETAKMKWKNRICGFNMTTPIVIDSLTYIATIGFVGKLNLNNGKYLWKHDDLYDSTRFDSFDLITIEGENICFTSKKYGYIYDRSGKVIVNDKSGKIEKIIKNKP